MYEVYKQMLGLQAYKVLTKFPTHPTENLAIGEDEVLYSIPLLIFTKQQLPTAKPVSYYDSKTPYEKLAVKGANDVLSIDDFVTDNFSLGRIYDSP